MKTVLVITLVVLWCAFMASVLMMSPKWWIGMWIWWFSSWWNEYWSKKSIEWKLKVVAMISGILFVWICAFLPFAS